MFPVTLLMPFDTARRYTFPPELRWSRLLTAQERAQGWSGLELTPQAEYPLGEPVCLKLAPDEELLAAEQAAGWLERGFELQVLFFSVGIGLLVLRGTLVRPAETGGSQINAWEDSAYARYEPWARRASEAFERLMNRVGLRPLELSPPESADHEAPWIYPLFFVPPERGGVPTLEVFSQQVIPIAISWVGSDVCHEAPMERAYIEWMFICASITWQGLFNLNKLLFRLSGELTHDTSRNGAAPSQHHREGILQLQLYTQRVLTTARAESWSLVRDGMRLFNAIQKEWDLAQRLKDIRFNDALLSRALKHQVKASREPVSAPPRSKRSAPTVRDGVFIGYSPEDRPWLDKLQNHLKILQQRAQPIRIWSDTDIKPGESQRQSIEAELARARVAVLLVSAAFLASNGDLPGRLERDGVIILWVLVSDCDYKKTALGKYQPVLPAEKPLDRIPTNRRAQALMRICTAIEQIYRPADEA